MRSFERWALCVAVLAAASPALAQRDDIPCLVPRQLVSPLGGLATGGSVSTMTGGVVHGYKHVDHDWAEVAKPAASESIPETRKVGYLQFDLAEHWADYDEIDGDPIPTVHLHVTSLGITYFGERFHAGVAIPWIDVDEAGGGDDAHGFGDAFGRFAFAPRGWKHVFCDPPPESGDLPTVIWGEILGAVSLPTGDEDEALGFGESTISAGFGLSVGRDRLPREHDAGHEVPWLRPVWLVELGSAYTREPDADVVNSALSVTTSWGVASFSGGVAVADKWERGAASDEDYTQVDLLLGIAFLHGTDFTASAGARLALNDAGPRADTTLGVDVTFRPDGRWGKPVARDCCDPQKSSTHQLPHDGGKQVPANPWTPAPLAPSPPAPESSDGP